MALTITYTGTGIVAYADGQTTDTGGGTWAELGAGTVGDNPDVYLYGSNSFGSKYAAKEGRTYYTDNAAINFSTTGDLIYMLVNIQSNGPFRTYGTGTFNGSFNMLAGQDTSNLRHWNIASKGASNGWTGGWKAFVLDPTITTGTETEGTPAATAIDVFGVWIDTDVSVRADSIFQSMIIAAKGATVTGTPTTAGEALNELAAWCVDYTSRAFPFIEVRGSTYFQKGGLTVGNGSTATTFSATGNNVECEESSYYTGSVWTSSYPSTANYITTTANAALVLENVNWAGYTSNKLQWDTSVGNASSVTGGSLKLVGAWTVKSTDTFDGVVFTENDALNLGAASYDNASFVNCGTQTISTTTSFTKNAIRPATSVTGLLTTDLDALDLCSFISGGTGHGVELTTAVDGEWDSTLSGYDVGSTGTNVGVTGASITGDEAIYVSASTGTVNISVASGGTVPSVASAGATINVTANQRTLSFTVSPLPTPDYEWRLYTVTALGSLAGSSEITGAEFETSATKTNIYTYTYSAGVYACIQIISDDYIEELDFFTLEDNNMSRTIDLTVNDND